MTGEKHVTTDLFYSNSALILQSPLLFRSLHCTLGRAGTSGDNTIVSDGVVGIRNLTRKKALTILTHRGCATLYYDYDRFAYNFELVAKASNYSGVKQDFFGYFLKYRISQALVIGLELDGI